MEIDARESVGPLDTGRDLVDAAAVAEVNAEFLSAAPQRDRRRLDLALSSARAASFATRDVPSRRGIPGLAKELFPAAAWRRKLDSLEFAEDRRTYSRLEEEKARVTFALARPRADDILAHAREQARRLVGTAAAVARARREQAERAAAATLTQAEQAAAHTLAAAKQQADDIASGSGADAAQMNDRLQRLRTALEHAETRLRAFSVSTRQALAASPGPIDLEAEQRRGTVEAAAALSDDAADEPFRAGSGEGGGPGTGLAVDRPEVESHGAPVPRPQPKSRFMVAGLSPDRIEALRDELTP